MQLSHCSRTDCTSLKVHHIAKYFRSNNVGLISISYTYFHIIAGLYFI